MYEQYVNVRRSSRARTDAEGDSSSRCKTNEQRGDDTRREESKDTDGRTDRHFNRLKENKLKKTKLNIQSLKLHIA